MTRGRSAIFWISAFFCACMIYGQQWGLAVVWAFAACLSFAA